MKQLLKEVLPRFVWRYLQTLRKYYDQRHYRRWAKRNSIDIDSYLKRLDKNLYEQMKLFSKSFRSHSLGANTPSNISKAQLAGGGAYSVLYFLVKKYQPLVVIETGVAFGHSSQAILRAMEENRKGKLYSSDLPYEEIPRSEDFIGLLVDSDLKKEWNLCTSGDEVCIPRFLNGLQDNIGIFHYDSDKRYHAREIVLSKIRSHLEENSLIIFDDIQDNFHFRDLVDTHDLKYIVFEFQGKYIGITSFGKPHLLEDLRV